MIRVLTVEPSPAASRQLIEIAGESCHRTPHDVVCTYAAAFQGLGRSRPPEQGLSAAGRLLIVLYPAGSIENWQATEIKVFILLTGSFPTYLISGNRCQG